MVVVIPIEATDRLVQLARIYQLNLPVPLSSRCAGYLSQEEMDSILTALTPLAKNGGMVEKFVADLVDYREQKMPITPCQ